MYMSQNNKRPLPAAFGSYHSVCLACAILRQFGCFLCLTPPLKFAGVNPMPAPSRAAQIFAITSSSEGDGAPSPLAFLTVRNSPLSPD